MYVCHIWFAIYHQYTPVMLAYIPYMDPMGNDLSLIYDGIYNDVNDNYILMCKWIFVGQLIYSKALRREIIFHSESDSERIWSELCQAGENHQVLVVWLISGWWFGCHFLFSH